MPQNYNFYCIDIGYHSNEFYDGKNGRHQNRT